MKPRGVSLRGLAVVFFILIAGLLLLFAHAIHQAETCVCAQLRIEQERRLGEDACQALAKGSDYLTGEVWHFVTTGDTRRMQNYWQEVKMTKSRDQAYSQLAALSLDEEERALAARAKAASDALIIKEAWAMRLIADSLGMTKGQLPPEVAAVAYTHGEEALSPRQKADLAVGFLFGQQYTSAKEVIRDNINELSLALRQRSNARLMEAVLETQNALRTSGILMLALVLIFLLNAALFYVALLRPVGRYTQALSVADAGCFTPLAPAGAREVRAFAGAFNQIYVDWQQQKQRLENEQYRFHVAMESASIIVFEYDPASDSYTACGALTDASQADGWPQERTVGRFLAEHIDQYMGEAGRAYFTAMLHGAAPSKTCDLKVFPQAAPEGLWARISSTAIYDEAGRLTKLIGKLINIQAEKEAELALAQARSRDGLTGLYKQDAGIACIRRYLAQRPQEEACALLLLDMDDFGQLNQAAGPVVGDALLQDVADVLRALCGSDELLVRLGGDEFMLCLKDCSCQQARLLGQTLAEAIADLTSPGNPQLIVSASIGICSTETADDYNGLYRCAASALRYLKEHGKGRAVCYEALPPEGQLHPQAHLISAIDRPEGVREDLPAFALELLGRARCLHEAIYLLLARIGRQLALERVMILEIDSQFLRLRPVYQWAADPGDRAAGEGFYTTRQALKALAAGYDEQGLSEQRFFADEQGLASLLHAGMWNYGECVGAMTLERREQAPWQPQERELAGELAKIIASFIQKARADATSWAKTDFLSRMSHEIRTPMNAITGMTIIAKESLDDPPKALDCLNKIEAANRYLLSLINDVLDMSRIESGKMTLSIAPVNLGELLSGVEALFRPQAEAKGLTFTSVADVVPGLGVMADALHLSQILVNLLSNAVKFTDAGGCVTLLVQTQARTEETCRLRFAVTDTGIGIAPEDQERIFLAFEQAEADTEAHYGGTGLGLAISSRLVQLMGGRLTVESAPGRGAAFAFTLALELVSPEADGPANDTPQAAAADSNGQRLLLVEDNDLNREIAQEILSMHGFAVEACADGQAAVSSFTDHAPYYYDGILMDIRMPVMDGMEATRRIRTSDRPDSRSIPIIALTANAFDDDLKKSLDNGMDGHLTKPINVDELLSTLHRLLNRQP